MPKTKPKSDFPGTDLTFRLKVPTSLVRDIRAGLEYPRQIEAYEASRLSQQSAEDGAVLRLFLRAYCKSG